ncbi:hypothetical protein FHS29_002654 [Saccharothrix tamanrassetensis]|uniref:DUF397 domain-containing protein n=1 Tax=Saccharothrix tamanrassetensis TaxID=1051531 RepID=A0A841CIP7_9PSEU|nr:DUF397 domain-containing protein [Saccharothrix tamanrassetensis]MBB5956068.1 hypothetical protein [Saccharothrix tamanrassetensis]
MTVSWRKSSYSGNSGGDCVELRVGLGAVRDSKNARVVLEVPSARLVAFLNAVKRG